MRTILRQPAAARTLVVLALGVVLAGRACAASPADTLVVAAAPAAATPPARVRAWQTGLARADRLEHASLSFTLAAGAGLAGGSRRNALLGTLAAGTVKELADRRHGHFDPVDLAADAIGAALGAWAATR